MPGKILVLLGVMDWFAKAMQNTGLVEIDTVYRDIFYLQKRIRTFYYHTGFSKAVWYNEWKNRIQEYDTVILFDAFLGTDVAEYIEEHAPHTRLIVFYYNPLFNNYYLKLRTLKSSIITIVQPLRSY